MTTRTAALSALLVLGTTLAAPVTFLSVQNEDQGATKIIGELAREYQKTNPASPYTYQNAPQTDLAQKLQLLAASSSLPTVYNIDQPALLGQLYKTGQAADLEATFKKLGIYNTLNPAAVALIKRQNDGRLVTLPLELNIEGFWYNKAIFAANGLKEPRTWAELVKDAATLNAKGLQPFAASGDQKWPLTRLIGGYAARKYGYDVMDRVKAGTLKLTDPGFVEAARAVQDLGKKNYFGKGVNTVDYATAVDQFLQGKAAMIYMGSWVLSDFNDAARNKIGTQNIGLFNFPAVTGGKGSTNDWSLNTGISTAVNQKFNDADLGNWIKYVFTRYGNKALAESGMITGFTVTQTPRNLPVLTSLTQTKLKAVKNGYLWFEANFSPKATSVATDNAQLLVTGDITPQDYMSKLQDALK
ncbi:ABC transporter substrate-binding protein [Deinococcus aquiradiocola]|uniref:ABC transporter substrate-binding protein n=1 Tax=Deinococcus aquiradiocola TaxID=393059 RepID=A0A917P8P0_9DEIO|nr:extracellular solute-binding protein [Deinococcus aquiradiocola]GGJ66636.1 ABC transporter substrate-binding protein [Deinococcus aquiradiocola]